MKMIKVTLIVILIVILLSQHVIAREKFFVYVYDKNERLTPDASIGIWISGDKIESGYTDSDGIYECWLDVNTRYRITAKKNNQFGEWIDTPNNNKHKIKIYME